MLLQSAAEQEGGASAPTRRHVRLLAYSLSDEEAPPTYAGEWVVPLPTFVNAAGKDRVAAQSELHHAGGTQFLLLPRDSGAGRGMDDALSRYRRVDVFDVAGATDVAGVYDGVGDAVASAGAYAVGLTAFSSLVFPPGVVCRCALLTGGVL